MTEAFTGSEGALFYSPNGAQDLGKVVFDNPLVIDLTAGTAIEPKASNNVNRSRTSTRRVGGIVGGALAALLVAQGGGIVSGQEPSGSPVPASTLQPGESAQPTDPITGAVICPPEASPSAEPSPSPTPKTIAKAEPMKYKSTLSDGSSITLFDDQTNPTAAPTFVIERPAPSASPDPLTAEVDPCAPTSVIPWTKETEIRKEKINFSNLTSAFNAFYIKYPEALEWTDSLGNTFTKDDESSTVTGCKTGHKDILIKNGVRKDQLKTAIKELRIISCAALIGKFLDFGMKYKNQEAIGLSLMTRDYSAQSMGNGALQEIYGNIELDYGSSGITILN